LKTGCSFPVGNSQQNKFGIGIGNSQHRLDGEFPTRDTTLVTYVIFQKTTGYQMMGPRIARESDFGFYAKFTTREPCFSRKFGCVFVGRKCASSILRGGKPFFEPFWSKKNWDRIPVFRNIRSGFGTGYRIRIISGIFRPDIRFAPTGSPHY
jgi:hypothetical protein